MGGVEAINAALFCLRRQALRWGVGGFSFNRNAAVEGSMLIGAFALGT